MNTENIISLFKTAFTLCSKKRFAVSLTLCRSEIDRERHFCRYNFDHVSKAWSKREGRSDVSHQFRPGSVNVMVFAPFSNRGGILCERSLNIIN